MRRGEGRGAACWLQGGLLNWRRRLGWTNAWYTVNVEALELLAHLTTVAAYDERATLIGD